jgi:hypothetical protein
MSTETNEREALRAAVEALEEIALAGMSGSGQESEEGMRDWHARRAWQFIGIAARALEPARAALSTPPAAVGTSAGIEAAARWVEARRDAYVEEHGSYDPETGGTDLPAAGAEYVGELDEIIEGLRAIKPPSPVVDDLKTLVVRLAQSLRKSAPDNDLPAKALDYVRRKGLYPSPLRTAADPTPEGCTPADARKLREANHALAVEVHQLREALGTLCDEQDARQGHASIDTYDKARAALARAVPAPTAGGAGGATSSEGANAQ